MMTTQEWMAQIDSKLSDLLKNKNSNLTPISDTLQETDSKFIKRRIIFVLAGMVSFMALTYLFFMYFLPLFNIAFGLMLAFICITLVILFDEYILPGDTIGKIASSPIASAILILAFAIIIIGGSQIGSGLITNRATAEESAPERVEKVTQSKSVNNNLQVNGQQQDSSSKNSKEQ